MPKDTTPALNAVVCLCTLYGCKDQVINNDEEPPLKGKLVSAQTRRNHIKKEKEWNARTEIPGSGPFASTQRVAGLLPHSESPASNKSKLTKQKDVDSAQSSNTNTNGGSAIFPTPLFGGIPSEEPYESPNTPAVALLQKLITGLTGNLAAWLHLACGLSQAATTRTLSTVNSLVQLAAQLGYYAAQAQISLSSGQVLPSIPGDVRTMISHLGIEPVLRRTVHFPECMCRYDLDNYPQYCTYRETPRSRVCGASLKRTVATGHGLKSDIPRRRYTTQDLKSWLEYFLTRPGIEDLINQSYHRQPNSEYMSSVWDSPAWQSIKDENGQPFSPQPGNLTFGFYIDWFNPLYNKIAGKTMSSGAIMFTCLNLPYELLDLAENTFFAGMTPPPHEPTASAMVHLMDPIVDQFDEMWEGDIIRTHCFPNGAFKRIGVLSGLGDSLAMRKAFGMAGVTSENHMCFMCDCKKRNIDDLSMVHRPRFGPEVYAAAYSSRQATTKKRRQEIFRESGVRWSPMLRLRYRDPVLHTMLGMMHNWIEGVLQHHVRIFLGIGVPKSSSKRPSHRTQATPRRDESDIDADLLSDYSESDMDTEHESDDSDNEGGPSQHRVCVISHSQLKEIRACISDAVIPSWIERPPSNLGEASHGKLKANQWLTLISVFLVLSLPEIWARENSAQSQLLLKNFTHLVTCTNIVCSHTTSNEMADIYTANYMQYRQTSLILFPTIPTRPNHHFAMHNGDLLKFWGPLAKLTENPGERHLGNLQNINTNGHIDSLDFTMLSQMCRKGRMQGLFRAQSQIPTTSFQGDSSNVPNPLKIYISATTMLNEPISSRNLPNEIPLDGRQTNHSTILPDALYDRILYLINSTRPVALSNHRYPPYLSPVHSPWGIAAKNITIKNRVFSTYSTHPGNSSISYFSPFNGALRAGFIQSIWQQDVEGHIRTFLIIQQPLSLNIEDQQKSPFRADMHGLLASVAYDEVGQEYEVIEPHSVQAHVPFYRRPPGTFGIQRATLVMLNSLHRNR